MNTEIKAKWIEALRSGRFLQGTMNLSHASRDGQRHCCLGVLCELAASEGVVEKHEPIETDDERSRTSYGISRDVYALPREVIEWAGLQERDPRLPPNDVASPMSLSQINDSWKYSFSRIADVIEKHL